MTLGHPHGVAHTIVASIYLLEEAIGSRDLNEEPIRFKEAVEDKNEMT